MFSSEARKWEVGYFTSSMRYYQLPDPHCIGMVTVGKQSESPVIQVPTFLLICYPPRKQTVQTNFIIAIFAPLQRF